MSYVNCHLCGVFFVSYVGSICFDEYFSFCLGVLVSLCLLCNMWLVFFFSSMGLQFCLLSFVLPMSCVLLILCF